MEQSYNNTLGSERTVEVLFLEEALKKCYTSGAILDVGGIPTDPTHMSSFYNYVESNNIPYEISDFRPPCKYLGDFVKLDFGTDVFSVAIFLSSLEHFPQCTESDTVFREGYDKLGYRKALSILEPGGYVILTVPFGKHMWQPYHQAYDWAGILELTQGSHIVESYTYKLVGDSWLLTDPHSMSNLVYPNQVGGVGCFILQKD